MIVVADTVEKGKELLKKEMEEVKGEFGYGETAYSLPLTYALTGIRAVDAEVAGQAYAKSGESPLVAAECTLAARREAEGHEGDPYTGFLSDTILRSLGYSLVDGSIVGIGLLVGSPESPDAAASICREMQEKYMLTFLAGGVVEVLRDAGVKVGAEYRLVPLGKEGIDAIHFLDVIARVAMMFGGVQPGDVERLLTYAAERAKAFVVAFPGLNPEEIAVIDSVRVLGIPVITPGGYESPEWVEEEPHAIVKTGMELKGIKVTVVAIPIPMACSPAFEGKSIRKEEMYVEFGGTRTPAFELLRVKPAGGVTDGRVEVIGPDIDQVTEGSALPLAILIDVAGKNMKKEFEPVFERRIHTFMNYGEGSWHVAQRDLIWVRISKEVVKKGITIGDLGKLLAAKFRIEFPDLIDAIQVTLITDEAKVNELIAGAREIYEERDERIAGMKDEDVELFYSCTLCQTFAPNHVCVITPERPALCGAISWLDAKIAYEIAPSGANQPVEKGNMISQRNGEFAGVNRFVKKASHGEVEQVSLYAMMDNPMTCCGCFECIAAVIPEVNGVLIVNRDYNGDTPIGMTFSTLAGTIGGGAQTPGFIGISKGYILSNRFLQAEGGIGRVVWMPSLLKEELGDRLREALERQGLEGMFDSIADEIKAVTIEDLIEYLDEKKHPALLMEALF